MDKENKSPKRSKQENKPENAERSPEIKAKKEKKIQETKKHAGQAIVNAKGLQISLKHAIAVADFIRSKDIDEALIKLELARKKKIAIPMKGEIPHRKGIMSGRYPLNAIINYIRLLKSLKANAIMNEIELEKYKIFCMPNVSSRPYKRFGQGRSKRANVTIKLIPRSK